MVNNRQQRQLQLRQQRRQEALNRQISAVYYDPKHPHSFGGKNKLKEIFPPDAVENWVRTQLPYSLHKPWRRRFPTRAYRCGGINILWQMDLLEMIPYSIVNRGYRYILICIDVFSRFVRARPVRTKTGEEIAETIAEIFEEDGKIPKYVQTDLGHEFYNAHVRRLFQRHNIVHYTVDSQFKAAIVERFNRTIREKMNRFFTHTGSKIWIDVFQSLIESYNNSSHRGIFNLKPSSINEENAFDLWLRKEEEERRNNAIRPNERQNLEVGDYVRLSRIAVHQPWNLNFDQYWSEEAFRIKAIDRRTKPIMYTIEDLHGTEIDGKFYKVELQFIGKEPPTIYRIERVLDERGEGIHKQYLVKWHGYSNEFNSWITARQFENYGGAT